MAFKKESIVPYLYLLPWVIGFILFTGGPIIAAIFISFTKWQYVPGWFRILGHTKSYSYFHGVLCDYHYVLEPFYCFTFKSKGPGYWCF